jgi:prepilin-type processing-associated H-X9-DG protein
MELLMVMGIIAILAALLFPVLGRTHAKAKATACLGNLRQWSMATSLFLLNNDDFLPKDGSASGSSTAEGWYVELPRAMGLPAYAEMAWRTNAAIDPGRSVWICPANPRRSNGKNLFHYCLNEHVNGIGSGNRVSITSIPRPACTVWLFDNGGAAPVAQQNNVHTNIHGRGAHFLLLDGHVARFKNTEYWDFARNRAITNNPDLIWHP